MDQEIQVRLTTHDDTYKITQNVFSISSNSTTVELQELLSNLLSVENVEFSFRVGEEWLGSTLRKHCESTNFSGESILEIIYAEKRQAPSEEEAVKLDDWISGVTISPSGIIYASLYNGHIAHLTPSRDVTTHEVHAKPIKSVSYITTLEPGRDVIVTSSLDQNLCYSHVTGEGCQVVYVLRGHTETVTSCDVSPSAEQIVSGSWDNYIKIWSTSQDDKEHQPKSKRKKGSAEEPLLRTPLLTLGGHSQVVTGCKWKDNSQILTTSHDMTVKLWDTQLMSCVRTISINSTLQCLDWSDKSQLIVTGSSDKYIRLFDPRGGTGTIVHSTLTGGHSTWVSSVAWSRDSHVELASGSYDGNVMLWDIRTTKSYLSLISKHDDKVLCLDWNDKNLISGGADSILHISKI